MELSGRIARFFLGSQLTPLIALLAILLGAFAVIVTPREEEPQINVTMANVLIPFPGASARDVETLVATPAEQVLSQMNGVEHVYSVSRPGIAVLTVQFVVGVPRIDALVRLYNRQLEPRLGVPISAWAIRSSSPGHRRCAHRRAHALDGGAAGGRVRAGARGARGGDRTQARSRDARGRHPGRAGTRGARAARCRSHERARRHGARRAQPARAVQYVAALGQAAQPEPRDRGRHGKLFRERRGCAQSGGGRVRGPAGAPARYRRGDRRPRPALALRLDWSQRGGASSGDTVDHQEGGRERGGRRRAGDAPRR